MIEQRTTGPAPGAILVVASEDGVFDRLKAALLVSRPSDVIVRAATAGQGAVMAHRLLTLERPITAVFIQAGIPFSSHVGAIPPGSVTAAIAAAHMIEDQGVSPNSLVAIVHEPAGAGIIARSRAFGTIIDSGDLDGNDDAHTHPGYATLAAFFVRASVPSDGGGEAATHMDAAA
jgi:hypothetical protein